MKKLILSLIFSIPYFVFSQSGFSYKIIGFSKDGLISYVTFRESQNLESGGPGDYEFFVYDLKSDKTLYLEGSPILDRDAVLEESFIINDYKKILSSYDIIINNEYKVINTYFIENCEYLNSELTIGDKYDIDIYTDIIHDIYHECYWGELNHYILSSTTHIFLNSYNLVPGMRKYLGKLQSHDCDGPYYYLGYYKSPFENRIALLFISYRNEEGEMGDTYIEFVGANLNPSTFK